MAREGLRIELSSTLRNAVSSGEEEHRPGISVKKNGEPQQIKLQVISFKTPGDVAGNYLVVFEDMDREAQSSASLDAWKRGGEQGHEARIAELEEELESSNQELKSTNEELQSSKKGLQYLNEECRRATPSCKAKWMSCQPPMRT